MWYSLFLTNNDTNNVNNFMGVDIVRKLKKQYQIRVSIKLNELNNRLSVLFS